MLRWYAAFTLAATATLAAAASDVHDLTPTTFASVVDPEPLILVEFFAPWCGHCKALAPEYEIAATTLKEKDIKLAKVDCVEHAELCQSWGVQGYPTLKLFRNGSATDYSGPRKADGIISYMTKQSLPAVSTITSADHESFQKADKLVVVAYLSSTSEAPAPEFSQAAEKHRDNYLFGLSTDEEAIAAAGVKPPAVVLYRSFDEPRVNYEDDASELTIQKLEDFVRLHSVPLFDRVGQDNYAVYAQSGLPLAYLFLDSEDSKNDAYVEALKPVAKTYQGKVNFVTIDAVQFSDHAKALNLLEVKWPAFVVQDLSVQLKYPLDQSAEITADAVGHHVEQFVAGKLEPALKSEPVPASQDEPVFVLTGKEFDKVVFDDDKDVFVEFYAPWCGHCKRLKPTWDSLGERYAAFQDRLTIAKMDATENDVPPTAGFRISGFPTLKFKKAGQREFIDYDGDRSLESLIEFVETYAKAPFDIAATTATESPKVSAPETAEPSHETHDEL